MKTVTWNDESIALNYPDMKNGCYATDNIEVDEKGVWVEYVDQDGETIFSYNLVTEDCYFYKRRYLYE